jgi:hypothetical protein
LAAITLIIGFILYFLTTTYAHGFWLLLVPGWDGFGWWEQLGVLMLIGAICYGLWFAIRHASFHQYFNHISTASDCVAKGGIWMDHYCDLHTPH